MLEHPGRAFQTRTAYHRQTLEDRELDWRSKPAAYKFYPYAPVITLPKPTPPAEADLDLWKSISARRSVRSYAVTPMTLMELSRLLWAGNGVTASFGQDFYRAAPSAGALYPIETYLVVNRVEGLEPGLYHYRVAGVDTWSAPSSRAATASNSSGREILAMRSRRRLWINGCAPRLPWSSRGRRSSREASGSTATARTAIST